MVVGMERSGGSHSLDHTRVHLMGVHRWRNRIKEEAPHAFMEKIAKKVRAMARMEILLKMKGKNHWFPSGRERISDLRGEKRINTGESGD